MRKSFVFGEEREKISVEKKPLKPVVQLVLGTQGNMTRGERGGGSKNVCSAQKVVCREKKKKKYSGQGGDYI